LTPNLKHQLLIHLDYSLTSDDLEVRYSYPFSGEHKLPEQVIRFSGDTIPNSIRSELLKLVEWLLSSIPKPEAVRLPHVQAEPTITPGVVTIVIQDQERSQALPIARAYYLEEVAPIGSRVERSVHKERGEFPAVQRESWNRLRQLIKGLAWRDYQRLFSKFQTDG